VQQLQLLINGASMCPYANLVCVASTVNAALTVLLIT